MGIGKVHKAVKDQNPSWQVVQFMSFHGILLFTFRSRGKALQAVGLVACAALVLL
jgi:hypothetical protein